MEYFHRELIVFTFIVFRMGRTQGSLIPLKLTRWNELWTLRRVIISWLLYGQSSNRLYMLLLLHLVRFLNNKSTYSIKKLNEYLVIVILWAKKPYALKMKINIYIIKKKNFKLKNMFKNRNIWKIRYLKLEKRKENK